MPKTPEPAPAGGAEALAVPWLALGDEANTSSECLSKTKTPGLFLTPPELARQAELCPRAALERCSCLPGS